jgi:glycosyltransferase involved in cell wall biosynthesis
LVLVEAMSCGIPVVAFNCPYGPTDIINDGKDGFLVKDRSIEVYANRVCQLMENDDLRQQMGKSAILSAQRYKAETIMPQWKCLFIDLLSSNKDEKRN